MADAIAGGCPEEEFKAMRCVKCGAPLKLNVNPHDARVFCITCDGVSSTHMLLTREAVIHPPVWWKKYVGGSWFR